LKSQAFKSPRFPLVKTNIRKVETDLTFQDSFLTGRKWRAVASATVTANFGSVLIYSVDLFRWGRKWLANWAVFL
jgi:hypothetical protein